jgi:Fur family transcriptional regulator, ferric uptake regulator
MTSTDDIVGKLRAHGERLTIQRRMVIDALCAEGGHLSVQDVQQHMAQRGTDVNETTVYRILQWLKDLELVSQTDLGQSIVYQVIGSKPHHHLVCLNCGAVIDIDDDVLEPLRDRLRHEFNFEPRIDHMAFFGTCLGCHDDDSD